MPGCLGSGSWKIPPAPPLLKQPSSLPQAEGSLNSIAGRGQRGRCLDQCWPTPGQDAQPETTGIPTITV